MHLRCLALALVLSVSGCYQAYDLDPSGDGGVGRDGGSLARDGGPTGIDAGPIRRDAGGPTSCETEVVGPWIGPPCSPEVQRCVERCADEECRNECFGSEPECAYCVYQTIIECANRQGCADAWREFACCSESVPVCAGLVGAERLNCGDSCPEQLDRYSECLNGTMCFFGIEEACRVRLF